MFIIDEIRKVNSRERNDLADRLMKVFRGTYHIPSGRYERYQFYEQNSILEMLADGEKFYSDFAELVEELPQSYFEAKQIFELASRQTRRFLKLSEKDQVKIPLHRWPRYIGDFEAIIKRSCYDSHDCISPLVRNLEITQKRIGQGGFVDVYLARNEKKEYAIRIAPSKSFENLRTIIKIKENLGANKVLFQARPFVRLEEVIGNSSNVISIMEYFNGTNVHKEKHKRMKWDVDLRKKVFRTYAEMLAFLHEKDYLFVDNSWANVLFNDKEVTVCDYDFVSKIDDLNYGQFTGIFTRIYASREQILCDEFSPSSDLEAFALMIDDIFNFESFIDEKYITNATNNIRKYPKSRERRLPKELRDIVSSLLNYPKDRSIRINDFLSVL